MFRAQCLICTELFESSSDIAAVFCGHTFHDHCLMQWIGQSSANKATCPQCRQSVSQKKIIHHLYFSQADEGDEIGNVDTARLQNELENARLAIKEKEREKVVIVTESKMLECKVAELQRQRSQMEDQVKQERCANAGMRRQLMSVQTQVEEAAEAKKAAKNIKQVLENYKNVKAVVNDSEQDVQEMLNNQNDKKQLATWCIVLKKELDNKRTECRSLRDNTDKSKKELILKKRAHYEQSQELQAAKEQIKLLEEDFKDMEERYNVAKAQLDKYKMRAPTPNSNKTSRDPVSSVTPKAKRVRLSDPGGGLDGSRCHVDLTRDEFDESPPKSSPGLIKPVLYSPDKAKFIKISSAATLPKPQTNSSEKQDNFAFSGFNIFRKKPSTATTSNVFREGYNGMGTHEKFIQPTGRLKAPPMKRSKSASSKVGIFKRSSTTSTHSQNTPPLPKMDGFLSQNLCYE